MLMGNQCTRNCSFCGIDKNPSPKPPDPDEPKRIANAVKQLRLKYTVLTSVTRDDLFDEGINHYINTIHEIKKMSPETKIEILTPDFKKNHNQLLPLILSPIHVYNHNLETVPRLYNEVRPQANYRTSLNLLKKVKEKNPNLLTKSGIMVGLGEETDEIFELIDNLARIQCNILTVGQYFQPLKTSRKVSEFKDDSFFQIIEQYGKKQGISFVYSGTYIRSSYHAEEIFSHFSL